MIVPGTISFRGIAEIALPRLPEILDHLHVPHRRAGPEIEMLNPTRDDRRFGSFRINMCSGRWADFATGDTGGDVVSLVAYLTGCRQVKAANVVPRGLSWC